MAKTAAALHILVKEEKLALDLLEQIKNGADFGKLAKKHSICPSGKRGGDLGEFRQGQMVPAFDKVVFSCPVLEPTGPLHTQFGYHIIKVLYRNYSQGLLQEKALSVFSLSLWERVGVRASART